MRGDRGATGFDSVRSYGGETKLPPTPDAGGRPIGIKPRRAFAGLLGTLGLAVRSVSREYPLTRSQFPRKSLDGDCGGYRREPRPTVGRAGGLEMAGWERFTVEAETGGHLVKAVRGFGGEVGVEKALGLEKADEGMALGRTVRTLFFEGLRDEDSHGERKRLVRSDKRSVASPPAIGPERCQPSEGGLKPCSSEWRTEHR